MNDSASEGPRTAGTHAQEWREDRDRLQEIMDNCTAVIYLKDTTGHYLFINRLFENLFHVSRPDVIGKTDFDIFPESHAAAFRANDVKVLSAGKPMEWEEVAPHDDGPHVYISLKFPMRDAAGKIYGVCGISSDISAFKRLQEEHNRFFNLSLDMLCVADFDGKFLRLNPSWERTLGWTAEELMSKPYLDFIHPDDRAATLGAAQRIREGAEIFSFENRYLCRDGSYRWLLWDALPLPEQKLIYAAARDISRRKQAERELAESAEELRKAVISEREAHNQLKRAQSHLVHAEKMVALGQIVAGVAHEINNPLAYVTTNLAVLERDIIAVRTLLGNYQEAERALGPGHAAVFERARSFADEIDAPYTLANLEGVVTRTVDGLRRIQVIVRDLRDFARGADREWHEVDLNAGIESTLNILNLKASKKKVQLVRDLGELPRLRCQPAKLNQVVLNLAGNAIDACDEGGRVVVRSRTIGPRIEIDVEDNGAGIPHSIMHKIFDPFFTTKAPGAGTGLGLSISHAIMEDHGGHIEVESTPGQGSRFRVVLPISIRSAAVD